MGKGGRAKLWGEKRKSDTVSTEPGTGLRDSGEAIVKDGRTGFPGDDPAGA